MSKDKKILLIIIANLVIIIFEIAFGYISNSFFLIADALHNSGDVLAIVITFLAVKLGARTTTFRETFGYIRAEMMAAFVNTFFLHLTMFYIIYQSFFRFFNPEVIDPIYMIVVGIIAVIANSISAYILNNISTQGHYHHHHEHSSNEEDINIKSAYLHMLSDALISVSVVVAGIFIYFFKIYYIDSILTIIFSIFMLFHSYPLLKMSFLSLMDINITKITKEELETIIKDDLSVLSYSNLHISKPSSKHNFISLCIHMNEDLATVARTKKIISNMKSKLEEKKFNHIVIEVDYEN